VNAQQLTLDAAPGTLVGTALYAIQTRTCIEHPDRPGTPHDGDVIPYCDECRAEHERKRAEARKKERDREHANSQSQNRRTHWA